jgi:hypothetical protein
MFIGHENDIHTEWETLTSFPAEHLVQGNKHIPLCSRVARKNLGAFLGILPEELSSYDIYRNLDFAPMGSAIDVHRIYQKGWVSDRMVWPYLSMENYWDTVWNPPKWATIADIFFSTPAGHRCVAFLWWDQKWYILDPYYHNSDIAPRNFPFPLDTYCAMLYFRKWALIEWVAFFKKPAK